MLVPTLDIKQKSLTGVTVRLSLYFGRNGGIRTRDPLHPMQVRYQAALRSVNRNYSGFLLPSKVHGFIIWLYSRMMIGF